MQLFGNIFVLFFGFGTIGFHALRNKLKLSFDELILILVSFTILLPTIRISNSIPEIRFEELIYYVFFINIVIVTIIKKMIVLNNRLVYILLYILGSIFLSTIYSQLVLGVKFTINDSFEFVKIIKYLVILLVLSNISYNEFFIKQVIKVLIISITLSAVFGICQSINLLNVNNLITPLYATTQLANIDNRIIGTTANPNDFGIFLISGIILAQNQLLLKRNKVLFYLFSIVIMLIAVILTVSRTTLLSLIIAEFVFIFIMFGRSNLPKLSVVLIIFFSVLAGAIVIKFASEYFVMRMSSGINMNEDMSLFLRIISWKQNLDLWAVSPLFGWGPAKNIHLAFVDNEYVLILRRYGIVGIIGYLAFYFVPLYEMSKAKFKKFLDHEITLINTMRVMLIVFLLFNITSVTFKNIQLMDLWMIMMSIFYSKRNEVVVETKAENPNM